MHFLISIYLLAVALAAPDPDPQPAVISGYIISSETQKELIAANITLVSNKQGTTTNLSGYYEIKNIEPGTYTIVSSYLGYQKFKQTLTLEPGERIRLDIALEPKAYQLEQVLITSEDNAKSQPDIGLAEINSAVLNDMPGIVERDVFRSLQLLPGVQSSSDFSSGLYIRGGTPDQTLVLLDGAPIYNPSHFFGFYSTFNPSAISGADLYKGNYPAQYGGRLGSVLNISNQRGTQEFGGAATLGLLATSGRISGPLSNKGGSWALNFRRSTLEPALGILKKSFDDIPDEFYFFDLNGKMHFSPNKKNAFSASFYSGQDYLMFPFAGSADINMDYGNQAFSANWEHIFSDKFSTSIHASGSRYFNNPYFSMGASPIERENSITDWSTRIEAHYSQGGHSLTLGTQTKRQHLKLKDKKENLVTFNRATQAYHTSFYLKDNWQITDQILFSPGIRVNYYSMGNYWRLEPRLSFEYRPTNSFKLQAAYGRYNQFLTLFSNEAFTGLDVWFSADEGVPPSYSDQFALGIKTTPRKGYQFDVELYYRSMNNLFEPDPFISDWGGLPYAKIFRFGNGFAYGAEFLFERQIGDITGFIGYTYSISQRKFAGFNVPVDQQNGSAQYYPTKYNRPHDLNIVLQYEFNEHWTLSTTFNYASGQPYTKPLGRSKTFNSPLSATDKPQIITGQKNRSRLPSYHRMDIAVSRKGTLFGVGQSELKLQIINAYSRRNVWFYQYDLDQSIAQRQEVPLLPLIPSFSYSMHF